MRVHSPSGFRPLGGNEGKHVQSSVAPGSCQPRRPHRPRLLGSAVALGLGVHRCRIDDFGPDELEDQLHPQPVAQLVGGQGLRGGALPEMISRSPRRVRRVLGRAQAVITPSSYLAAAIAPLGIAAEQIPQVLALDRYSYRHRSRLAPRLLWMRTFHPLYNPALAVETLRASGSVLPIRNLPSLAATTLLPSTTQREVQSLRSNVS